MNIGQVIKELRKEKGLSQEQLAKAANLAQTSLSKIENGKRPGIQTMEALSKALGVPEVVMHIMALEKSDIPKTNQPLFDQLFPAIKKMIVTLTHMPEEPAQ